MEPRLLLRVSGVFSALALGSSALIEAGYVYGTNAAVLVVEVLLLAAFAAGFWFNTGRLDARKPEWRRVALFVAQIVIALSISVELALVAVASLPMVVGRRRVFVWLAGLMLILLSLAGASAVVGDFVVSETVAHVPRPLGMLLTTIMMISWVAFSFSAGYLILRVEESRQQTEWAMAQLEGSQHLLAETTRLGERLRISRELHDAVGHHLMGLSVNLEVASHLAGSEAIPALERARLVTSLLLAEIREVLSNLREERSLGLRPVLEKLATALREPVCHLEVGDDVDPLPPDAARALFRCAQEALTNAARHSGARNVWVSVTRAGERLLFEARDDGRGAAHVTPGCGLRGMRERFTELGGEFHYQSAPAKGFALKGWLPLPTGTSWSGS